MMKKTKQHHKYNNNAASAWIMNKSKQFFFHVLDNDVDTSMPGTEGFLRTLDRKSGSLEQTRDALVLIFT